MASRYWVLGTGTWDNSSTTNWSTTSGGSGGASVPGASDDVILDASSGGGTVTPNYDLSVKSITMGAFTGTLDFSANNNSPTMATFNCTGTGTRTLNMGSGTWTITGNNTNVIDLTVTTNLTFNANTSTVNFTYSGSTGTRTIIIGSAISFYNIKISAGTDTFTNTANNLYILGTMDFTGFTGTKADRNINIYGNLIFGTGMTYTAGTQGFNFTSTGASQLTTNGVFIDAPILFAKNGAGTVTLQDDLSVGSTRTITLQSGTFNANNFNVTCGIFSSSNSNTRTFIMGSGTWTLTGNNATIWTTSTATNLTLNAGTSTVNCTYSGSTGSRTFSHGTAATALNNVSISAGSDTFVNNGTSPTYAGNLNFTGFTGTWNMGTFNLTGNLILGIGMTTTSGINILTLNSTGTQSITSNGVSILGTAGGITQNGVGGTVTLNDDLTMASTKTLTLTNGTFNANNKNVTCGIFSSSNSNTRTFIMGTGTYTLTGNAATIWNFGTTTGLTFTKSGGTINATYSGSTGTRTIHLQQAGDVNVNISAGSDTIAWASATYITNLNWTGFTGTTDISSASFDVSGNLTWSSGMSFTANAYAVTMNGVGNTQTITSNGLTLNRILIFSNAAGTITLADDLNLGNNILEPNNGTFDANGKNVTCSALVDGASGTKVINMGTGTWTLTGTGNLWNYGSNGAQYTINPSTSTIKITDSSGTSVTFGGGNKTYNNIWFSRGTSTGTITLTGSNNFADIKDDGSIGHSLLFTAGTTTGFTTWNVNGHDAGNKIVISSPTAATHTLKNNGSSPVLANYLAISYSIAT